MGLTRVQYRTEAWETQALGGCTHRSPWGSPADEGRAGPPRRPGWCQPSAGRGRRAGWSQTAAGVLGDRRDLAPQSGLCSPHAGAGAPGTAQKPYRPATMLPGQPRALPASGCHRSPSHTPRLLQPDEQERDLGGVLAAPRQSTATASGHVRGALSTAGAALPEPITHSRPEPST